MSARIAQPIAGIAQRRAAKCGIVAEFIPFSANPLTNTPHLESEAAFPLLLDPRQRTVPTTALHCNRFDLLS
jgi:hypothetical protein